MLHRNPPHNMTDIDLMTIKTLVADLTPQEIAVIPSVYIFLCFIFFKFRFNIFNIYKLLL